MEQEPLGLGFLVSREGPSGVYSEDNPDHSASLTAEVECAGVSGEVSQAPPKV